MKHLCASIAACLGTILATFELEAAPSYSLVDLGPGSARSINTAGKVVGNGPTVAWLYDGTARTNLTFRQYMLYSPSGLLTDWPNQTAVGINDAGMITGTSRFPFGISGIPFPYVYSGGPYAIVLGTESLGQAINGVGLAVGGQGSSAFIFDGKSISRFASPGAVPVAINNSGVVAGFDINPKGSAARAARFVGGVTQALNLAAIPNPTGLELWSEARGINSSGAIVGFIRTVRDGALDPVRAFIHSNGSASDLGGLGGLRTVPHAINDRGVIVGSGTVPDGTSRAFVRIGSEMTDLNAALSSGGSGWVLTAAHAINADGLIVGEGLKQGVQTAFLLRPGAEVQPPVIARQPTGASVPAGASFSLSVLASGEGPFSYQWRRAGTNLPGATSAIFTVASATANDAGKYQVVVSNRAGNTPSAEVTVDVRIRSELALREYTDVARIEINGTVGRTYRIEAAEDPDGPWSSVGTIQLQASPSVWLDPDSPRNPLRVYRAVELP